MYEIIMVIMGIVVIAVLIVMMFILLSFMFSEREGYLNEQRRRNQKDYKS